MPRKVDANTTDSSMDLNEMPNNQEKLTQIKYTMINMALLNHKFIFYLEIKMITQR